MTYLQATQSDAVGPLHPPMQLTWQHVSPSHTPELQLAGQAEASMKVIKIEPEYVISNSEAF